MEDERTAVLVTVTGRVQGVAYRAWAAAKARKLGLHGWVENRDDGAVSALIVGPHNSVRKMVEAMRSGPPGASVANLMVERDSTVLLEEPQEFSIRR